MKISDNGIAFIKKEEGERLDAYLGAVGIPTIGVCHTGEVHGMPIAKNTRITAEESTALLKEDLQMTESTIAKNITALLSQNQYDALCSLIFNIGSGAFAGSSVKRKLNAWDYKGAADAFLMWKRAGKDLDILLPRRQRERELFLS
ncbi:lysozyme [Erwinia tracheiphila]|uniref:Lysozyme n=1 Tax=Erwinia tracheiphila TaxID=65700 RepID=A0A0M2K643_9GAMM|nr:lysozyme [Erwinia tracheiphila]EOS96672.1 phage related lysozyme [Erwinia tracheiphila PSU-1]KKF34850.1 muraminidase [Erwinia tracheiphila]UIA86516.1 lysozyme [Erwinia tracheiphila]UIA94869.1 lysozyme [Erwinia tracheiphila]